MLSLTNNTKSFNTNTPLSILKPHHSSVTGVILAEKMYTLKFKTGSGMRAGIPKFQVGYSHQSLFYFRM